MVILVVAVLMSIGLMSFKGAKHGSATRQAIAVAQTYNSAVEKFMVDHSGRTPLFASGSRDWPMGGKAAWWGPRAKLVSATKVGSYLRSGVPDSVQTGRVMLASGSRAPGQYSVTYIKASPGSYRIEVHTPDRAVCWLGNAPGAGPRCK